MGLLLTAAAIFATVAFFAVAVTLVVAAILVGLGISLWMRWRRGGAPVHPGAMPRATSQGGSRDVIDVDATVMDEKD